ncbi:MAG: recombination regulator RecX [Spirochaetia bacterium]|nr:recombination regulator RecX [Spirochaetia bacterium]
MDRKAHELSSSSQNVNQSVFGHIRRGAAGKGYFAVSEDGSSFFIPRPIVERLALRDAQSLTEQEYLSLQAECEMMTVRLKALDLLAMRDHSVQELRLKLIKRSYDEQVIERVIADLIASRLLDDRRFAEIWIRIRLRKRPMSIMMLIAGLAQKGISHEIAQEAVEEAQIDTQELVQRAVLKYRKSGEDPVRFIARLVRKGFPYRDVKLAVDRLSSPEED